MAISPTECATEIIKCKFPYEYDNAQHSKLASRLVDWVEWSKTATGCTIQEEFLLANGRDYDKMGVHAGALTHCL